VTPLVEALSNGEHDVRDTTTRGARRLARRVDEEFEYHLVPEVPREAGGAPYASFLAPSGRASPGPGGRRGGRRRRLPTPWGPGGRVGPHLLRKPLVGAIVALSQGSCPSDAAFAVLRQLRSQGEGLAREGGSAPTLRGVIVRDGRDVRFWPDATGHRGTQGPRTSCWQRED
jgi:hypothetical protein